jgi:hypothetical protein
MEKFSQLKSDELGSHLDLAYFCRTTVECCLLCVMELGLAGTKNSSIRTTFRQSIHLQNIRFVSFIDKNQWEMPFSENGDPTHNY